MKINIKKKRFFRLSVALIILIMLSFLFFLKDFNEGSDGASQADAIVILTGGLGRSEEGLKLFKEGKGGYLIISGVHSKRRLAEIFPGKNLKSIVNTSRIILDTDSKSTMENAVNVKKIIEDKGFRSVILVTSNYHMKRAYTIFRKTLDKDLTIYKHPVAGPNFGNEWWKNSKSIRLVLNEFVKYCGFQIWQRWSVPSDTRLNNM